MGAAQRGVLQVSDRLAEEGKLRRLFADVYTGNLDSPPAAVVLRNWATIVDAAAGPSLQERFIASEPRAMLENLSRGRGLANRTLTQEYQRLAGIIGALLGTHERKRLQSRQALARTFAALRVAS